MVLLIYFFLKMKQDFNTWRRILLKSKLKTFAKIVV